MASNYKFSNEEMAAIKAARAETKDKRADARLKALELRAEGMELSEVSQATGFHAAYVSQLVAKYRDHGLEAISGNHYGGNHRNMSFEEEAVILAPFKARAEKGELVEISEIETAYQQAVGHSIGTSQIYNGPQEIDHLFQMNRERGKINQRKRKEPILCHEGNTHRNLRPRSFSPGRAGAGSHCCGEQPESQHGAQLES